MKEKTERCLSSFNNDLKLKGFKAFKLEQDEQATMMYSRKDFYKICLTTGESKIHYSDKSFTQEGTVLFFGNPHIPYSWETISTSYQGYTCLFSEDFLHPTERVDSVLQSPLFKLGGTPVLNISTAQRELLNSIFDKILEEQKSNYQFKDDVIRNYIQLILHEAMRLEPSQQMQNQGNAASRLTAVFLELLERQFPVETPTRPLQLKTAQQYAESLSVHVNYLNRAVKEVTGKSTSTHISERIIAEAKALLQHTNWNISEIGYALGFDYPTYFNNFFKKQTGVNPRAMRVASV